MGEEHQVGAKLPLSSHWNQHYICFLVRVELACERNAYQMKAFDNGQAITP
jgi:hypothetical protein